MDEACNFPKVGLVPPHSEEKQDKRRYRYDEEGIAKIGDTGYSDCRRRDEEKGINNACDKDGENNL